MSSNNSCGLKYENFLRLLSLLHLLLMISNFIILDPRIFIPLFVIYSTGVINFFTMMIYSFVAYRAWFFVFTEILQMIFILLAGYLAAISLMGYFTIKMTLLRLLFAVNTMLIIIDVMAFIIMGFIRSNHLRERATRRAPKFDVERSFVKY